MPSPVRRNNTGKWYLDVRVPEDVAESFGKKRVRKSLNTYDPAEAKVVHNLEYASLQATWERLRHRSSSPPVRLTQKQTVALAGKHYEHLMERFEEDPPVLEQTRETLATLKSVEHRMDLRGTWFVKVIETLLDDEGIAIDDDSHSRLGSALYDASVQAIANFERFAQGDYSPDPMAKRFPEWKPPQAQGEATAAKPTTSIGPTLDELFKRWAASHTAAGKAKGTISDYLKRIESFKSYIGHQNATQVTRQDVGNWVTYLLEEKRLNPKTVRGKYLAALSRIYSLSKGRGVLETNPAEGIEVDVPKAIVTREKGFTDAEAAMILTAAQEDPATLGNMGDKNKAAIRWVPWIAAYTGARVAEITQLHKSDFLDEGGVFCLRITPEGGKSVKTGEYRIVPVHSHLLETGIMAFLGGCSEGPLFYEPPANSEDHLSRARSAGEKVRKWVRATVGIKDKGVQPNHGWRHRFKTLCRREGIEQYYADAIQGHADGRASSGYGDVEVAALKREIEKITWQV